MRRTRKEIQISEQYWGEATNFVKRKSDDPKNPSWFKVSREMPRHIEAWRDYFKWRLGFVTHALNLLADGKIEVFFTPTEWPEWFDAKYQSGVDHAA